MTQKEANKIFSSELGQQLSEIYVTHDDRVFIRYEEARDYSIENDLNIFKIQKWYNES
jgi:hypothetical protein